MYLYLVTGYLVICGNSPCKVLEIPWTKHNEQKTFMIIQIHSRPRILVVISTHNPIDTRIGKNTSHVVPAMHGDEKVYMVRYNENIGLENQFHWWKPNCRARS